MGVLGLVLVGEALRAGLPVWGATTDLTGFRAQIVFYLLLAAAINAGIIAVLAAFWPRLRGLQRHDVSITPPQAAQGRSWSLGLAVALGMILAASLAYPRLSQSLWGDEHWSLRESISGRFQRDLSSATLAEAQGALYWDGLSWEDAFWRYETTNQHFLYTVLAKASNSIWRAATGRPDYAFSEVALRVAPLLIGLIGLALWAKVLRPLSLAAACLFPILMAVHPWFIRYISEGRGYAMLFAILPALYLALRAAARSSRLRAWVPVIIAQILLLYAWPGMLPVGIGIQLAVGVSLYWRRGRGRLAAPPRHWAMANLATSMLLLQLLAPCIPQIWEYLGEEVPQRPLGTFWLTNEASRLAIGCEGIDYDHYSETNPLYITAQGLLASAPVRTSLTFALLLGGLLVGGVRWLRRAPLGVAFSCGLAGSTAAVYCLAAVTGTALYQWYFVHLLPFMFALVALGFAGTTRTLVAAIARRCLIRDRGQAILRAALLLAPVALYALTVSPQLRALRSRSLDPRRESVALSRPDLPIDDPAHLDTITAHCLQASLNYDPHGWLLRHADSPPDSEDGPGLVQLMRLADTTGATLWVNASAIDILPREHPRIARMLATAELFAPPVVVHGLEPQFVRHLYRYRGGLFDFLPSP